MGKYDQCRHGEPEGHCAACAACVACNGECGTCPYAPMTPAVPDPTVEALSETERAELEAHFGDHQRLNSQGVCATCHGMAAVERILAARAAAPDALRVAVEALAAEWNAHWKDLQHLADRESAARTSVYQACEQALREAMGDGV